MAEAQGSACGPDSASPVANWYFLLTLLYGIFVGSTIFLGEGSSQSISSLNFGAEDCIPHLPETCLSHQAAGMQRYLLPILPVEMLLP